MFGSSGCWLLHQPIQWADNEEFTKLGSVAKVPAIVSVAVEWDIKYITDFADIIGLHDAGLHHCWGHFHCACQFLTCRNKGIGYGR